MDHGPSMHDNFLLSHFKPSKQILGYEVALKGKKQIAEGTMAFIFAKPANFQFKAGQHVRLTLINPPETDSKGNRRFLTLANTPQEQDLIVAMRMTGTAFKRVLANMEIGEKVLIEMMLHSAHGSFTLHDDASRPAVFLVGGIGIVPAFSIIKDTIERRLPHKMFLFYSNRRPEDAPFLAEFQTLAKQNSNFKLIATMTEPEKLAKPWNGETGFIDQDMLKRYVDDLKSPIYYIAGLSEMVKAMKTLLKNVGIDEDNIRAEDFSEAKMQIMTRLPGAWKNYFTFIVIGFVIILGFIVHAGAVMSLYSAVLLKQLSYFTLVLILLIVLFKIFAIVKLKHHITQKKKDKE